MSEEPIDLRGTQGSVVLPSGTVVQNYPPPTPMPHDDSAREQIEIALLKNDVATNKSDIRDLWAAVRRLESMVGSVLTPNRIDASLFIAIAITILIAVASAVYLGGNWGG